MRRSPLVVALVLAAATASVAADGLDLSLVAMRVQQGLDDPETSPEARRSYEAIARRLARPDRPGLADDFRKLEFVARHLRGPLADDAGLSTAAATAVEAGLGALDAEESAATVAALDLEVPGNVVRAQRILRRGRRQEARARTAMTLGRTSGACARARLAAVAYRDAEVFVARAVERESARPPAWHVVLDGLGGALLSVHVAPEGPAPVHVVGADDGAGPTFLRGGREGFVRIHVAAAGDLWWVDAVPDAGVWACGTGGSVVVYDPATGALTQRPVADQPGILYGVWGGAADDVWTVGEDPDADGPLPAVFRWTGEGWSPAALPPEAAGLTLYKVWGTGPSDVWACGRSGALLHFDGDAWSWVPSGTTSSLLTVHGDAPGLAVGLAPVLVERDASGTWSPVAVPPGTEALNGCRVAADGDAWAVGYFRTVLRRTTRGWAHVTGVPTTQGRDYHSVTVDAAGGVWIAGGVLTSRTAGVLLHFGPRTVASAVLPSSRLEGSGGRVGQVFHDSCAQTACHAPPFVSEGLDLSTEEGRRERLVGVPSRQSSLPLVAPGRPSASYLFRKLEGTQLAVGGSGVRMPDGETLTQGDVDSVRAWILEGAPSGE